ncbi:MAG: FtsX-like permease family protein [Bacteroidales bacterium]|nr:FtsX-like permease family protein [Bacteroidales bacterium]MCM1416939.1 FtsX-like permease family protein [bacterium]MCM1424632.1 FtsX-like permease family protein [bacterium]
MYLQILKKDLKRKKTMNAILLIFVILAATFIAGSANNLITISGALDDFFEKANVPDQWFLSTNADDVERFRTFAKEEGCDYTVSQMIQIDPKNILVEGEPFECSNTACLSTLCALRIFDKNDEEITHINDGEVWVANYIFESTENNFREGAKVYISQNGVEKEFTVRGYTKDAVCGSAQMSITRFFVSDNDVKLFDNGKNALCNAVEVYTEDPDYADRFNALEINAVINTYRPTIKMVYFMDLLIAAILLVVSVCLILISMVILRFIIQFTVSEEFREIGVMKAIGIKNAAIRGLYAVKYFVIAVLGTTIGLGFSVPFGRMMVESISRKIIISGGDHFLINIGAAVLAGASVVFFSYFCTRKIEKLSPIDAIRSGETGERYRKKGLLHLGGSHLPAVPFMALNDIFSGLKNYVSMILIFILGTLLLIIPVNTVNTLRSDNIITLFNMVKSDHVISQELLLSPGGNNRKKAEEEFARVHDMFAGHGIDVDVFQEIMFRSNIKRGDKRTDSISFQGLGGVTADQYDYLEGTPPQNPQEVALALLTAEQIDAGIGDDVEIKIGEDIKTYTVAAIYQSMNNMGEGVRFHQDADPDYGYAAGSFGMQVNYRDNPDDAALDERKALLKALYPNADIYTSGAYIEYMMGDITGQLDSVKALILAIVLGINALVAVLMVKSFITKEKNEIALLKAIGFQDTPLTLWQTMRIGIVLIVSVLVGALSSRLFSALIITPIFRMMGAYSIDYEIRAAEVYLMYPLIVLAVTAAAAFVSAQGVRKISAADISNNE